MCCSLTGVRNAASAYYQHCAPVEPLKTIGCALVPTAVLTAGGALFTTAAVGLRYGVTLSAIFVVAKIIDQLVRPLIILCNSGQPLSELQEYIFNIAKYAVSAVIVAPFSPNVDMIGIATVYLIAATGLTIFQT